MYFDSLNGSSSIYNILEYAPVLNKNSYEYASVLNKSTLDLL